MAQYEAPLLALTALLGEALDGAPAPSTTIDAAVVALAARRHFVAPLLYRVAANGRHIIASSLLDQLAASYQNSQRRRELALARLEQIARMFAACHIAWISLKGPLQAALLYSDPAVRESSDLDILVPAGAFNAALRALEEMGFIASYPPVPGAGLGRCLVLGAVRDITLIAADDRSCAVDLHRRLFVGAEAPHLPLAAQGLPAPAAGPELALYLLAHGAVSFWVRLRWTTDLVRLLPMLKPSDLLSLRQKSEQLGMAETVAASLLLLWTLYPFLPLAPLKDWLAGMAAGHAVQHRLRRYRQMMLQPSDWKSSPLDKAALTLEANWLLSRSPRSRAQLLVRAPVSSAARRLAGLFYPRQRALTLCSSPP